MKEKLIEILSKIKWSRIIDWLFSNDDEDGEEAEE
jgi:hypothetical protein